MWETIPQRCRKHHPVNVDTKQERNKGVLQKFKACRQAGRHDIPIWVSVVFVDEFLDILA